MIRMYLRTKTEGNNYKMKLRMMKLCTKTFGPGFSFTEI